MRTVGKLIDYLTGDGIYSLFVLIGGAFIIALSLVMTIKAKVILDRVSRWFNVTLDKRTHALLLIIYKITGLAIAIWLTYLGIRLIVLMSHWVLMAN